MPSSSGWIVPADAEDSIPPVLLHKMDGGTASSLSTDAEDGIHKRQCDISIVKCTSLNYDFKTV